MADSFPSLSHNARAFPLPTIAEDTLHYTLHLSAEGDTDATALSVLITEYVESLLIQPWLWNKDGWELKAVDPGVSSRSSFHSRSILEGTMRVGDAVDDEWVVVWILREVSKKWKDLVIRDTDGEFLLIEAANELPSWVSPENAENRLWLSNGHLHLIPLTVRSSTSGLPRRIPDEEDEEKRWDPETYLSEEDGVSAVRTGKYRASEEMENAVWARVDCYPGALKTHQHRTKAWVPEKVARALSIHPELIQKAVEAFYVRDPAQLRAASRMTHFPPSPAVLSSILMTRAAYAQLQGQVFHPPRVFGPEWHVREGQELDKERRWRDLGVKIATGFEILYREGGKRARASITDIDVDAIRQDPAYESFIANLRRAGFFGNELQGSAKYNQREEEAIKGWKQVQSADTSSQRPSFAAQVDEAIDASSSRSIETLQATADSAEDSDSWLEVSPDELDDMLRRTSGRTESGGGEKQELGGEDGQAMGDLARKVQEFVGGQGDIEGARFVDELSDEDMDDDSEDDEEQNEEPELTPAEKEEMMKNLVAPLSELEWGSKTQKPVSESDTVVIGSAKQASSTKTDPAPKIRPPLFAKQQFDGVESDSDEEMDEADLPAPGTLGRRIAEMKWSEMGPQIEEIDDEDEKDARAARSRKFDLGHDIDDQMRRKVWGENEPEVGEDAPMVVDEAEGEDVDMGLEEDEFIRFSKEALGIDENMWKSIVDSRKERGAFVPQPSPAPVSTTSTGGLRSAQHIPSQTTAGTIAAPLPASSEGSDTTERAEPNTALNSFDTVMAAMDAELARIKGKAGPAAEVQNRSQTKLSEKAKSQSENAKKGKKQVKFDSLPNLPSEADLDDLDEDDLAAMDRELRAALKNAGVDDLTDEEDGGIPEVDELDDEGKEEYRMMKDFLESYKSQGGSSGVVGNLFGRLGEDSRRK